MSNSTDPLKALYKAAEDVLDARRRLRHAEDALTLAQGAVDSTEGVLAVIMGQVYDLVHGDPEQFREGHPLHASTVEMLEQASAAPPNPSQYPLPFDGETEHVDAGDPRPDGMRCLVHGNDTGQDTTDKGFKHCGRCMRELEWHPNLLEETPKP